VIGVIPGVIGLIILLFCGLTAFPRLLYINSSKFRLYEFKLGIPFKHDFEYDSLQCVDIGKRRMTMKSWLLFFFLLYWASIIWNYGFDSVLNNGSWYYFQVEQWVWDGTEIIFTINLGFHLFISVLILVISGLLIVVLPRKDAVIETGSYQIRFPYHSIHLRKNISNNSQESPALLKIFKLFKNKVQKSDTEISEENNINTIVEPINNLRSNIYIPRFKLILLGISVLSLFVMLFIPGFFFGDFLLPFGMMGFCTFLFMLLNLIFYEVHSKQYLQPAKI
jgi:hypothetical protein